MNIPLLLTPKSQVLFVTTDEHLEQAIERVRASGFSAVPVLGTAGEYVGTLTEGDILWHILGATSAEPLQPYPVLMETTLCNVPLRRVIRPVHVNAEPIALVARALHQNFIPVVDDRGVFIGIVTRKRILEHFLNVNASKTGSTSLNQTQRGCASRNNTATECERPIRTRDRGPSQ